MIPTIDIGALVNIYRSKRKEGVEMSTALQETTNGMSDDIRDALWEAIHPKEVSTETKKPSTATLVVSPPPAIPLEEDEYEKTLRGRRCLGRDDRE